MGRIIFMRKGNVHTAPVYGIRANALEVGTTVKLMENGAEVEYLVVHQGLPSDLYSESCNGTWLMRKNIYSTSKWSSTDSYYYNISIVHEYLNDTYYNMLGTAEHKAIKQVKVPCFAKIGTLDSTDLYGEDGLSTKVFLPSVYELGWTQSNDSNMHIDGACLSYFSNTTATDSKRIGYLNDSAAIWWTRSRKDTVWYVYYVTTSGGYNTNTCVQTYGIRPTVILTSRAVFDENTLVLKGVA